MGEVPWLIWVVDSFGRESAHQNGPSLSYRDSYLGYIFRRDGKWWYEVGTGETKQEKGPFESYARSRIALTNRLLNP